MIGCQPTQNPMATKPRNKLGHAPSTGHSMSPVGNNARPIFLAQLRKGLVMLQGVAASLRATPISRTTFSSRGRSRRRTGQCSPNIPTRRSKTQLNSTSGRSFWARAFAAAEKTASSRFTALRRAHFARCPRQASVTFVASRAKNVRDGALVSSRTPRSVTAVRRRCRDSSAGSC